MISKFDHTEGTEQLKKIDEQLFEIGKQIQFALINPTNIEHEKKIVLSDSDYNPLFEYEDVDFESTIAEIESINSHNSIMGNIFEKKRIGILNRAKAIQSRGTSQFTKHGLNSFGQGTKGLIDDAKKLLDVTQTETGKTESSLTAVHQLHAEVKHYGFDYLVDHVDMSASAMVQPSKRIVLLNKNMRYSQRFIKQLIVHEIGTHVLRAENGRLQPYKIFATGFPNYLATEEGFAVYNEERCGLLDKRVLQKYAARAIATDMALDKSFSEIYNYLQTYMSKDWAFQFALRAKRGLGDSSKPGGCTKDYVYLDGYLKVKGFIEGGGSIKDLYYGKIGLEHVDDVKKIPGIKTPKFLLRKDLFKALTEF